MSDFNFFYELYNKSGECVVTQSVTGKRIAPMLEHIAKIVSEQERTHGKGVTVHMLKARINESVKSGLKKRFTNVLVDPKRMESLSTLVTMGVEHYSAKIGDLVVENTYPKNKIVENLRAVLSNPKKAKKLMAELKLPDLEIGDELLVGKFKNRRAEIKGFSNDEHNQPVADTTKGDQKIFKPRIAKLMPGAEEKKSEEAPVEENVQGDVRKHKETHPEKYCTNPKCLWRVSSGPCPKHGEKK